MRFSDGRAFDGRAGIDAITAHPRDMGRSIGKTHRMRRGLAGILFGIAYTCASLALSGWLLQRIAFSPDHTADAAEVVLGDSKIKHELAEIIAKATAAQLASDPATVQALVEQVAANPAGARLMADIIHDAQAKLIGASDAPVVITPQQLVQVVRSEEVLVLPAVELPVPRVAALDVTRSVLRLLVPIAALGAVGFAVLGGLAHPERTALLQSLSFGLLLLAMLVAVLGYVVPSYLVPALSDNVWARVPKRLANDELPLMIGLVLVLVGGAGACFAASGMMSRRRRWSAPVSTYRYNEERRWN